MREQAQIAIDTADCIIMVVDVRDGLTAADEDVAHMLRRSHKPIILAVNKCDKVGDAPMEMYEFYNLGFDEVMPISSVHGHGTGDLLDAQRRPSGLQQDKPGGKRTASQFAIIGRECGAEVQPDQPHSGREPHDHGKRGGASTVVTIDTPVDNALRLCKFISLPNTADDPKHQTSPTVWAVIVVRALAAVGRSPRGADPYGCHRISFTEAGQQGGQLCPRSGQGVAIIVFNKWDAVEGKETNTMELQRRDYAECFSFMGYAPIIFISAQTGYNVNKLMQLIRDVDSQTMPACCRHAGEMLARATARMQPPSDKGRRLKIFYLTQASTRPPTFVSAVNSSGYSIQLPAISDQLRSARTFWSWNTHSPSVW